MKKSPAVEHIYREGQVAAVAKACQITTQAVAQWHAVPVRRVPAVERVTGLKRHQIRPDVYEAPRRR